MNDKSSILTALLLACALITALACGGCALKPKQEYSSSSEYKTVNDGPRRNSERAKSENDKAVELLEQGQFDQAEKALKKALTADITFGPAHNNLGKCYYHQGQMYLAAWEFEYAIKLMPHQPEPKANLGLVFEHVGKLDQAADCYGKALELQPDNVQFIGNLARAKIRQGEKSAVVKDLLSDLVLKDTRAEWVNWAKQKLAMMGDDDEDDDNQEP